MSPEGGAAGTPLWLTHRFARKRRAKREGRAAEGTGSKDCDLCRAPQDLLIRWCENIAGRRAGRGGGLTTTTKYDGRDGRLAARLREVLEGGIGGGDGRGRGPPALPLRRALEEPEREGGFVTRS